MATNQIPRLAASPRTLMGSRNTLRIRKAGKLPAVIYGHKQEPLHVTVDKNEFIELAHRNVHLLEISVGSNSEPCLIKELQWDHLGSNVIHVDLARVDLTEKVTLEVEIELVGEPIGTKQAGAFLQQFHNVIEIQCLATQIPELIKVDVTHLKVDEHLEVKDIKLPEGVTAVTDGDVAIAGVVVAVAEEEPAGGTTAEPEVIGKKLEEGEAAASAGGAKKPDAKKPDAKK